MNHMKSTYRVKHRLRQEENDPSQVADQWETARKEVASKRVRPTLYLPEDSQPSTKLAGLFSSSETVGPSTAPPTSPLTTNSSGSGGSVFSMPSSSVPSSSLPSLFMTPTTSAPVSPLSGSSSATPQTSLLNSSPSSLFGSTPSQFDSTAPSCGTTSGGSTSSTSFSLGTSKSIALKTKQPRSRTPRR